MTHRDINKLITEREAKLAASDEELIEAREQADAGIRAALPQFMESLERVESGSAPKPEPVSAEAIQKTGTDLLDIRAALQVIGTRFPLDGDEEIHGWVNALINGTDSLAALLSERSPG